MTGASAKSRGALEVIVFEESRFRGSLMFTSAEVTVGSDPGVMVRLDDANLAPCHAVLLFDGETCTIENYDTHTGTWVNGVPVERQELAPTDEIQIGRFRLRLTVHRADATPTPVMPRPPRPAAAVPVPARTPANAVPPPPSPPPSAPPRLPSPAAPASRSASPPLRPQSPVPPTSAIRPPSPVPATSATSRATPPPPTHTGRGLPSPGASGKKTVKVAPLAPAPPAPPPAPSRPSSTISVHRLPANGAPVALAVAASPVEVLDRLEPLPAKPALASVPASPPAPRQPTRTSTQPLAPRPGAPRVAQARVVNVGIEPVADPAWPLAPLLDDLLDDDDEDEDATLTPGFSLLDHLRTSGTSAAQRSAVEVIRFRHGCVLELRHLRRGEKLRLHGMRTPVGRCSHAGGFLFQRAAVPDSAAVSIGGHAVDDADWRSRADGHGRIALEPATQVVFPLPSGDGVLIHLVPAAGPLPRSTWRPRLTKLMLVLAGASIAAHLVVFAILGLARFVRRDYIADNKDGRFARIALKEVELEPPAPPPRPEREKEKKKPKPETATPSEPPPKLASLHLPRHRVPSTPHTESAATTQKLLSALGSTSAGPKPLSATAMSNLDAVGPIRGGGFKVSGAIGKLPGDSLRLAAAGSGVGRLETKSTSDVGKNLGRVLGRGPSGQVRAQVTARPNTMKVEGHLDRGEIQKVINSHIHELQGCYERQLIVNPNLSGKVTFEWVISVSGAVVVVKIKSSTLSSNEATSCMQAAIRRWIFPRPSGGQVTVIYPIALASSGT